MHDVPRFEARGRDADSGPRRTDSARASRGPRLVLLFLLGALLINFPLLAISNRAETLGGVPVVYLYLFGVWIAGIVGVFSLVGRQSDDP